MMKMLMLLSYDGDNDVAVSRESAFSRTALRVSVF